MWRIESLKGKALKNNLETAKGCARLMIMSIRAHGFHQDKQWVTISSIDIATGEMSLRYRYYVHDDILYFADENGKTISQNPLVLWKK